MRESVNKGLIALGFAIAIMIGAASITQAGVPQLLNFQGILLDTELGTVIDSTYDITFRIYDDSTGGMVKWEESQNLKTENGLFNTFLGQSIPLPDSVFNSDARWFEIELIGVGPYEPRNRIGSVAYAYRVNTVDGATGGSIYGNLQIHSGLTAGDSEGNAGFIEVTDGTSIVFATDGATAVTSFSGPASSVDLDMASTGDNSVILPGDAISAGEQLDEPGISSNFDAADIVVPQGLLVMTDLVSTTITIPTDGYIVVRGRSNFKTSGTAGQNIAHIQIDESQGGGDLEDYQSVFGIDAHSNSGTHNFLFTVYTDRIYFKSAGSHTFRLEARPLEDNSEGAVSTFSNSFITAAFFSTSYGSVNATASSGNTAAVRGSGSSSRVDLRDLELQAAHLRADAERAQRELLEAKLSRPDNR